MNQKARAGLLLAWAGPLALIALAVGLTIVLDEALRKYGLPSSGGWLQYGLPPAALFLTVGVNLMANRLGRGGASVLLLAVFTLVGAHVLMLLRRIQRLEQLHLAVPLLAGFVFIGLGIVTASLEPRSPLGLRLPWTLRDDRTWISTHRILGAGFGLSGTAALVGAFISPENAFYISVLGPVLALIFTAGFSWYLAPKMEDSEPSNRPS